MGFAIRFSHWGYYGFCHVYPYGFSHSMSFAIISKQLWYHVFSHATLQYFAQHRLPLLLIMMEIIIMTMTMTITMTVTVTVTCIQKIIVEDRDAHCKVHKMISLKSLKHPFTSLKPTASLDIRQQFPPGWVKKWKEFHSKEASISQATAQDGCFCPAIENCLWNFLRWQINFHLPWS